MRVRSNKTFLVAAWLWIAVAAAALLGEIPGKVTVSLPVQAAVEGVTLQPGTYVMVVENFDGEKATIKIFPDGSDTLRVAASVKAFQSPTPASRNAVKVVAREGGYYLDKLLLAGEKTGFQFRT